MDHPVIEVARVGGVVLTRRPLRLLGDLEVEEGIREPHKADRLTNRLRRMEYRLTKHGRPKAAYNRRQRHLYHAKVQHGHKTTSGKREAPKKYMGTRFRKR